MLCSLPPTFVFPKVRGSLPLIGQTAAPLQAHWVVAALLQAMSHVVAGLPLCEPYRGHVEFQSKLQMLAFHLWPTARTSVPRPIHLRFDTCIIVAQVEALATVEHLISAQRSLGGWGERVQVTFQGCQVPSNAILRTAVYDVSSHAPAQLASAPSGVASYFIEAGERAWAGQFPAGCLVSTLLSHLGFSYSIGLRLDTGSSLLTWGDRLWHGISARVLLCGAGMGPVGLSHEVLLEASKLINSAKLPTGFVMLPILDLSNALHLDSIRAELWLRSVLLVRAQKVFGIFCFQGRWAAFSVDRAMAIATYYDGLPGFAEAPARALIRLVSIVLNEPIYVVKTMSLVAQTVGDHCGTIALAHLGSFLHLWSAASDQFVRAWFARLWGHPSNASGLSARGNADYTRAVALLTEELPKHGVPADAHTTRIAHALKRLGAGPVLRAFESRSPWQALKTLGNLQDRPFAWVLHPELEKHVESRALGKRAPTQKGKKVVKPHTLPNRWLSPLHRCAFTLKRSVMTMRIPFLRFRLTAFRLLLVELQLCPLIKLTGFLLITSDCPWIAWLF